MSKLEFKLNRKGVAALMKSSNMQKVLGNHASNIKKRSGSGYQQDMYVGKNRANARVWADSPEAKKDNLKNNTILKSVK
uniref:Type I neck protein n=1 Tax=Siphoviridae sp. ctwrX9 TaxID=2825735 RepID=A0A8S5PV63_9CAUD|nr:MAG TPA: type I neck protein [Siphoviridae sp. ctwrX9]